MTRVDRFKFQGILRSEPFGYPTPNWHKPEKCHSLACERERRLIDARLADLNITKASSVCHLGPETFRQTV